MENNYGLESLYKRERGRGVGDETDGVQGSRKNIFNVI